MDKSSHPLFNVDVHAFNLMLVDFKHAKVAPIENDR